MSKVLYVAGPMTGIPRFNFPLFDAVSAALRAQGYTIISPAETDHEQTRAAAMASETGDVAELATVEGAETWGDCLARDVKMLADGFPVDTEESDDSFRARVLAAQKMADESAAAAGIDAPLLKELGFVRRIDRSLLKIDGLALLPNWEKSRGARLEAFVGLLTGKEYFTVEAYRHGPTQDVDYFLHPSSPDWVKSMLAKDWADAIMMHTPIYP